jgi:hypothetical protein
MEEREATHAVTERHELGGVRYELSIKNQAGRHFGSWLCLECMTRNETEGFAGEGEARIAASADMDLHHTVQHGGQPGSHVIGIPSKT